MDYVYSGITLYYLIYTQSDGKPTKSLSLFILVNSILIINDGIILSFPAGNLKGNSHSNSTPRVHPQAIVTLLWL